MFTTLLLAAFLVTPQGPAATPTTTVAASTGRHFALRLRPGQDLQREILAFAKRENLRAAAIVTCVGSLKTAHVRFANQPAGTSLGGHLMPGSTVYTTAEIVLVELNEIAFSREKDNETTCDELVIRPRK